MTRRSDRGRGGEGNLEDAARRFQETVEDLAARAGDEMGERAAAFLDDAADRLRGDREDTSGSRERRSGSRRRGRDRHYGPYWHGSSARGPRERSGLYGDYQPWEWRSRKLYLDDENGKLVGVCAGIAKYFGMEGWVVRCIAVTGLIFMPSIVFPAYWVAYFVMDHAPEGEGEEKGKGKGKRRRGKRRRRERDARRAEAPDANAEDRAPPRPHRPGARDGRALLAAPQPAGRAGGLHGARTAPAPDGIPRDVRTVRTAAGAAPDRHVTLRPSAGGQAPATIRSG